MFITFLDESGQPGGFNIENNKLVENTSKYFTLSGFMIDADAIALHLLMERCCMEITDRRGRNTTVPAMIIADSRKTNNNNKLDKELQIAYLRAKNMGTHFVEFPNFCETLVFADSDYYLGIQIADFCAGAIHRKYENKDDTFFKQIEPAIRKHKGKIYGPGIKLY